MSTSYEQQYSRKLEYLSEQVEADVVPQADADAIRELVFAFDENRPTITKPDWSDADGPLNDYRSVSTLGNWTACLRRYSEELGDMNSSLLESTTMEINRCAERWLQGESVVTDNKLTRGSIRAYQTAARIFYRFHEVETIEHSDITVFSQEEPSVDPRDMLMREEITDLREAADNPRDLTIIDLLLYTGMRNTALRYLRVKDVDLEESRWYFNTNAEGLKDVAQPNSPRPLLGARPTVQSWLDYHPDPQPENYLITGRPKWGRADPTTPISHSTVTRALDKAKEESGIDKPLHPHAMRHNFVTLSKREYGLDDSTTKFLIGHDQGSTVMETTYQHLSGEDFVEKAEVGAGVRDDDGESSLTPENCPQCGTHLDPNWTICPKCELEFGPDVESLEELVREAIFEEKGAADDEAEADVDDLYRLIRKHPDAIANAIRNSDEVGLEELRDRLE